MRNYEAQLTRRLVAHTQALERVQQIEADFRSLLCDRVLPELIDILTGIQGTILRTKRKVAVGRETRT